MARKFDLNLCGNLVWETMQPTVGKYCISSKFYLQNCKCAFSFGRNSQESEIFYNLSLYVCSDVGNRSDCSLGYTVTVCVKKRGESPQLSTTSYHEIKIGHTTIWTFKESDILKEVPDIFSGPVIFCITFDAYANKQTLLLQSVIDNSEKMEEKACKKNEISIRLKEKSVQTSLDPNPNPCYESLSKDLSKLLNESVPKDVELRCGDHAVSAHKVVLCTRSPVLSKMLESDMEEGRTGLVEIKDMQYEVLVAFLRYLYTGTLPELTTNTAMRLYEAGDKYEVQALMARCSHFLRENLEVENACDLLSLADAHSDSSFKDYVIAYVIENKIPLLGKGWQEFCSGHPVLATDVLNRFCKLYVSS